VALRAILERIERNGYDVFSRRAATTKADKLRTAAILWAAERRGAPRSLVDLTHQREG